MKWLWCGVKVISCLPSHEPQLFHCLHPPPPKQLTDIWYSRAGCQVILESSPHAWRSTGSYQQPSNTSIASITMMIRLVLVWTVVSAVAAFDVFGASHEVRLESDWTWCWHWLLAGITSWQLVRGEQNTPGRGCEFCRGKSSLTSVYISFSGISGGWPQDRTGTRAWRGWRRRGGRRFPTVRGFWGRGLLWRYLCWRSLPRGQKCRLTRQSRQDSVLSDSGKGGQIKRIMKTIYIKKINKY